MTNTVLAELPLTGASYESLLNAPGTFSATLPLTGDPKVAAIDPIGSTQPGRTALYIDRDGTLVWGGIIWKRRYISSQNALALAGKDFISYLGRRQVRAEKAYASVDVLAIAADLLNYMQALPSGNIGINVPVVSSGVAASVIMHPWELRNILTEITTLAQAPVGTGFDFSVDVAYVGGVPTKTWVPSFPRRGSGANRTGWVFELPGNIYDYDAPEDAEIMANLVSGAGAGSAETMLLSTQTDTSGWGNATLPGYPILEDTAANKTITDQGVLDAYTRGRIIALQSPAQPFTLNVSPNSDPVFGSYTKGDEARIKIRDNRFPSGLDVFFRIIGTKVQTATKSSPEQVSLVLGPPL
ncbi:MAG TPA: hypothetical protein VGQ42_15595 [Candidatus Dormibacteraeota bacterium]|nr:hypothetical protein [Candidatus Dormibacteraeota bacterium]